MSTIRITPSKLESFRCHVDGEYNGFITVEKMISKIRGDDPWTPQATFGSAFGLVVQFGMKKYQKNGKGILTVQDDQMPEAVILTPDEVKYAQELHDRYPEAVYESWCWLDMNLNNGMKNKAPFKTDFLDGGCIHEVKTTKHKVDTDMYGKSLQAKCYLHHLDADSIEYHVFKYLGHTKTRDHYLVSPPVEFKLYNYEGMERDIFSWSNRFVEFCELHNLLDYITK